MTRNENQKLFIGDDFIIKFIMSHRHLQFIFKWKSLILIIGKY